MGYRLLVDLEVIAFLDSLSKNKRRTILEHFAELRSSPDQHADYQEQDSVGRRIEISVFAGHAICYWIDFANRHVKILTIRPADL